MSKVINLLGIIDYQLLADTKLPDNTTQNFIRGDFSDDGSDVVEGFAEVLGDEVGREGSAVVCCS